MWLKFIKIFEAKGKFFSLVKMFISLSLFDFSSSLARPTLASSSYLDIIQIFFVKKKSDPSQIKCSE
jgi:hypothetical protein